MYEQLDLFETSKEEPIQEENSGSAKLPQESSLTPRQWDLYRLVKFNSLVLHRKTTQREIYEKVRGYEWNDDEKAHDHCVAIWKDVKDNNMSFEHDHIIITKNFEYWIGSEEENEKFIRGLWDDLSPRLTRYWTYLKKINKHAQGKLIDKNMNVIDEESKAKRFFDCFNDYNVEMQKEGEEE